MDQSLIETVTRVLLLARNAGLEEQDQRDAAIAAAWAVAPTESPAIARLLVQLIYPELSRSAAA